MVDFHFPNRLAIGIPTDGGSPLVEGDLLGANANMVLEGRYNIQIKFRRRYVGIYGCAPFSMQDSLGTINKACLPVLPHEAVAEVLMTGTYRRGESL